MIRYEFKSKSELKKFFAQIKKDLIKAKISLPVESQKLSKMAGTWMARRVTIKTKRAGSSGDLANALRACSTFRGSVKGFNIGIGDTSLLPDYWAMINYGGFISPESVPGFWTDTPTGKSAISRKTGEFVYMKGRGNEFGFMYPKKPIKGFHYIAYAYVRMLAYVRTMTIYKK